MDVVRELAGQGTGVIFISHRMAEIDTLCDRVQVLCNGMNADEMRVGDALDVQRALSWMGGNLNDGNEGPGNEPEAPSVQKKEHPVHGPGRVVVMPVFRVRGLKAGKRANTPRLK